MTSLHSEQSQAVHHCAQQPTEGATDNRLEVSTTLTDTGRTFACFMEKTHNTNCPFSWRSIWNGKYKYSHIQWGMHRAAAKAHILLPMYIVQNTSMPKYMCPTPPCLTQSRRTDGQSFSATSSTFSSPPSPFPGSRSCTNKTTTRLGR